MDELYDKLLYDDYESDKGNEGYQEGLVKVVSSEKYYSKEVKRGKFYSISASY